jgi:hypothetical protein
MSEQSTKQMARDTVSALLEAIEALVARGSLQANDVQGLLRRTIQQMPEPDRAVLLPAAADATRSRRSKKDV